MPGLMVLPAAVWVLRSKRRRAAGLYSRSMLEAAFAAWRLNPSAQTLLHWAATRRDMGRPVTRTIALGLLEALPGLRAAKRVRALALLLEAFPTLAANVPPLLQQQLAERFPALAGMVAPAGAAQGVAAVGVQQAAWRQAFADDVVGAAALAGLAVVGNAAQLHTLSAGEHIDACDLVLRFNHYGRAPELLPRVGRKTNVWVLSPSYKGPLPEQLPQWVVLTGPAMEYGLKNWAILQPLLEQGCRVVSVPLDIWRTCVKQLQAPPSAGVLVLCWLQHLLGGSLRNVRVAGVGGYLPGSSYHVVPEHKGSTARHNWQAESAWLQQWAEHTRLG